jgi:exosome complex component RRP43
MIDCINTTEGSSLVKIGNTSMMCGIKCEVGLPTDKDPNGEFFVTINLPSSSSHKFQQQKSLESLRSSIKTFVDIILANSLDISQLDILNEEKEKIAVWVLYLDVYCLEHDGNLFDSTLMSVISALQDGIFLKLKKSKSLLYKFQMKVWFL